MTENGAPDTAVSTGENVLVPETGGQFMAYRKTSSSQVSGTYWTPPPTAGSEGNGMGPRATSKSPYGRGGTGGASRRSCGGLFATWISCLASGGGGRLPGPR